MTTDYTITNKQARQLLLHRHGLLGKKRYQGKNGTLNYIKEIGSLQFDPIDVCGRTADITLHSRVTNYQTADLQQLLYQDRSLIDYFDKNLGIYPIEDFQKFHHHKRWKRENGQQIAALAEIKPIIFDKINEKQAVNVADFDFDEKVQWDWGTNKLSRAALEYLYQTGDLLIHHKEQTRKFYTLPEIVLDKSELALDTNHFETEQDFYTWIVKRRISNVGFLWNKASDAWLGIPGFKAKNRQDSFAHLAEQGELIKLTVSGLTEPLYLLKNDEPFLTDVLKGPVLSKRLEFIAPLDALIWDRKLIKQLFHFDYKWEIYTPADQRKYGHYVLPILYGSDFIGRIELKNNRQEAHLSLENYWLEDAVKLTATLKKKLNNALSSFARFNACQTWDTIK